jgi:hypothetical protein
VIEEQLAIVRRYERAEVAQMLKIKETWLKRWVTARCIPHQRSGDPNGKQQRGVWFTWADILAVGEMLPELMTEHQAKWVAAADAAPLVLGGPELITTDMLDEWASIGLS